MDTVMTNEHTSTEGSSRAVRVKRERGGCESDEFKSGHGSS